MSGATIAHAGGSGGQHGTPGFSQLLLVHFGILQRLPALLVLRARLALPLVLVLVTAVGFFLRLHLIVDVLDVRRLQLESLVVLLVLRLRLSLHVTDVEVETGGGLRSGCLFFFFVC